MDISDCYGRPKIYSVTHDIGTEHWPIHTSMSFVWRRHRSKRSWTSIINWGDSVMYFGVDERDIKHYWIPISKKNVIIWHKCIVWRSNIDRPWIIRHNSSLNQNHVNQWNINMIMMPRPLWHFYIIINYKIIFNWILNQIIRHWRDTPWNMILYWRHNIKCWVVLMPIPVIPHWDGIPINSPCPFKIRPP